MNIIFFKNLNFKLGCGCRAFQSNFLCAACDKHWEQHETFFETERERKEKKLPYGDQYKPFNELAELKNVLYDENEQAIPIDYSSGIFHKLKMIDNFNFLNDYFIFD